MRHDLHCERASSFCEMVEEWIKWLCLNTRLDRREWELLSNGKKREGEWRAAEYKRAEGEPSGNLTQTIYTYSRLIYKKKEQDLNNRINPSIKIYPLVKNKGMLTMGLEDKLEQEFRFRNWESRLIELFGLLHSELADSAEIGTSNLGTELSLTKWARLVIVNWTQPSSQICGQ